MIDHDPYSTRVGTGAHCPKWTPWLTLSSCNTAAQPPHFRWTATKQTQGPTNPAFLGCLRFWQLFCACQSGVGSDARVPPRRHMPRINLIGPCKPRGTGSLASSSAAYGMAQWQHAYPLPTSSTQQRTPLVGTRGWTSRTICSGFGGEIGQ